jgi:hypothetical protein
MISAAKATNAEDRMKAGKVPRENIGIKLLPRGRLRWGEKMRKLTSKATNKIC